jgi:hypothetical protein
MKYTIVRLNTRKLRDGAHVRYHEDIMNLIDRVDPPREDLALLVTTYKQAFGKEIERLYLIRLSALTADIRRQDLARESLYRGITETVRGAARHYDPGKRAAARVLLHVITHYGNLPGDNYAAQSAALDDFVREMEEPARVEALENLGLKEWVQRVYEANATFQALVRERYEELGTRPTGTMLEAREAVDDAYRAIIRRVEAIVELEPTPAIAQLVAEWNVVAKTCVDSIAKARGRRAAKRKHEEETAGGTAGGTERDPERDAGRSPA